jgi:hypothetical protein
VDITFYNNVNGIPGSVPCSFPGFVSTPASNLTGDLQIPIPSCTLPSGPYFVSVVANMHIAPGGQWGWRVQPTQHFDPAVFQNPIGGLGGCTTWGTLANCVQSGPDLRFRLDGCSF